MKEKQRRTEGSEMQREEAEKYCGWLPKHKNSSAYGNIKPAYYYYSITLTSVLDFKRQHSVYTVSLPSRKG